MWQASSFEPVTIGLAGKGDPERGVCMVAEVQADYPSESTGAVARG